VYENTKVILGETVIFMENEDGKVEIKKLDVE
jgi:hypothetical protein